MGTGSPRQGKAVDPRRRKLRPSLLHRDQDVFHGVGNPHRSIEADHPRGALDRMGGAHERLDPRAVVGVRLERDQAFVQDRRVGLHLGAKQRQQREVFRVTAHAKALCRRAMSSSGSSSATRAPSSSNSALVIAWRSPVTVAGGGMSIRRGMRVTPSISSTGKIQR